MHVERNLYKRFLYLINNSCSLVLCTALQQFLNKVVSEGICHQIFHVLHDLAKYCTNNLHRMISLFPNSASLSLCKIQFSSFHLNYYRIPPCLLRQRVFVKICIHVDPLRWEKFYQLLPPGYHTSSSFPYHSNRFCDPFHQTHPSVYGRWNRFLVNPARLDIIIIIIVIIKIKSETQAKLTSLWKFKN